MFVQPPQECNKLPLKNKYYYYLLINMQVLGAISRPNNTPIMKTSKMCVAYSPDLHNKSTVVFYCSINSSRYNHGYPDKYLYN